MLFSRRTIEKNVHRLTKPEPEDKSPPLTTERVLREEALAILGCDPGDADPKKLPEFYRTLNEFGFAALCLSGGGIRSAAFSLGVIQALAVNPRLPTGEPVRQAEDSLLTEFHYFSTVSGGGYIGSWLAAWRTRDSFANVWRSLVGRPDGFDMEPPPISWLRSYSSYLTPKLGFLSADSWAIIAIYIQNLLLNWLVILPFIAVPILGVKIIASVLVAVAQIKDPWYAWYPPAFFGLAGIFFLFMTISFAAGNRSSIQNNARVDFGKGGENQGEPLRTGARSLHPKGVKRSNNDQRAFLLRRLLPSLLSALFLTECLASDATGNAFQQVKDGIIDPLTGWLVPAWSMSQIAGLGGLAGGAIYALGWICGTAQPNKYDFRDLAAWIVSGALFGAIVGIGFHFYLQIPDTLPVYDNSLLVAIQDSDVMYLLLGVPWVLFAFWCADTALIGLTTHQSQFDANQEWFARSGGWLLVTMVAWLLFLFLILAGFLTEIKSPAVSAVKLFLEHWFMPIGIIAGLVIAIVGRGGTAGHSARTEWSFFSIFTNIALAIAAPLFFVAMIFGISTGLDAIVLGHRLFDESSYAEVLEHIRQGNLNPFGELLFILLGSCAVLFVLGVVLSKLININRISLHTLYRNRLVRAFLGASAAIRNPNLFTDFDTRDNLQMNDLWPDKSPMEKARWRPFLVLNLTLNIVSANRLAWQERKAAPFTVTALHCGTGSKTYQRGLEQGRTIDRPIGAYRYSAKYGHPLRGMSLGTAMAISGAAANPNMGYHSSPAITFIMTMLNVRLGWWLGNPGEEGQLTYNHEGPQTAIVPLFEETFGLTTDSKEYVHLSDGGHFDNLGLYEMVRRRCRFILVIDSGCDPNFKFEDLGNAVRKIAIDFGIQIRLSNLEGLRSRARTDALEERQRVYFTMGEIDYKLVDPESKNGNGVLIYIKPCYYGSESAGIRSYAVAHRDFPHQGTANQWFTESQFEAYRSLGFEIMDGLLRTALRGNESAGRPTIKALCDALRDPGEHHDHGLEPRSAATFCR